MPTDGTKIVYLHVGAPKTGTTYLQSVLWKNRDALAANGVLYPLQQPGEHFPAALDLRQMRWGGGWNPRWDGAWERIAQRVRAWSGKVAVISNELLGGATTRQVRRAVASVQPAEVHVVFTARDLARQLPSDWQEHIKHRHTVTFDQFVGDLLDYGIDAPHPFGEMFWGLHDASRVLDTWSSWVPPRWVHIVTLPQAGAPQGLLWQRFADVIGLDPTRCDTDVAKTNTSMGAVETELVRRLNLNLGHRLGGHYDPLMRVSLAENLLGARPNKAAITLPGKYHDRVVEYSTTMVSDLRAAGYNVVGDLDELIPTPPPGEGSEQSRPAGDVTPQLLDVATDSIPGLLSHVVAAEERESRLRQQIQHEELDQRRRQPVKTLSSEALARALTRARGMWARVVERIPRRLARH